MKLCTDNHLFENHELIQEVNALAGEEFPDGLLSLEALRVTGGAHLGGLVPQELSQRVTLQKRSNQARIHLFTPQNVCLCRKCIFCHCKVPTTIQIHSSVCHYLFLCACRVNLSSYCLEILVLAQFVSFIHCRSFPPTAILLVLSKLLNTEIYLDCKSESVS